MKFPHNTDAFANYLAGIAQVDDNRDYRVMLAREQSKDDAEREAVWAYDAKIAQEERDHYAQLDSEEHEREERESFAERRS